MKTRKFFFLAYTALQLAGMVGFAASSRAELKIPTRIDRGFFEMNLAATIQVTTPAQNQETDSNVKFDVGEKMGPGPVGAYIADYRDQQGCVEFDASRGTKVCFTLPGDVSTVDVTAEKVSLEGADQLSGCPVQNVKFEKGVKGGTDEAKTLTVQFSGNDCNGPVSFAVNLRQI